MIRSFSLIDHELGTLLWQSWSGRRADPKRKDGKGGEEDVKSAREGGILLCGAV